MDSILEELFYGNISPLTDSRRKHKSDAQLISDISEYYDRLQDYLNNQQREILEKFDQCCSERMLNEESDIFVYAFKLGARLMLAVTAENSRFSF